MNDNPNVATTETQTKRILEYMANGGHLTPLDALRKFGSFRLSAIIFNISKQIGKPVNRKRVQVTNTEGKPVWVMEYWLEKKYKANSTYTSSSTVGKDENDG